MRVLALVAVVGCGRLDFAPLPRADASGDSANATDAACTWSAFSMPARLQGPILSGFDDWMPTPTLDETALFFHSYRAAQSDLFVATRATTADQFGMPVVVTELSTATSQWTPALTNDGLLIMFADDELGPFHLKTASRASAGAMFGAATDVPVVGGTSGQQDKSPWLAPDGLRLVFTSNRSGADQLYESTRPNRTSNFAPPVQLALGSGDARDAALSADALEVFFVSDRSGGIGMLDIWTARRSDVTQPFSTPTVVPELSSARDDTGVRISIDGKTMYMNYDTLTAGGGQADIYTATRTCL